LFPSSIPKGRRVRERSQQDGKVREIRDGKKRVRLSKRKINKGGDNRL
jgi:hypothetical protein